MDGTRFDTVARRLASGMNRREVLRGLVAGAVAALSGGAALGAASAQEDDLARRRCKRAGAPCTSNRQCCPKKTNRICAVQRNAGNSDETCCGAEGARCGGKNQIGDDLKPYCCVGFECRGTTCRKA